MKDKIIKEWFERGKRDFESARIIYSQRGYFDEVIFFLIHYGIEIMEIYRPLKEDI